MLEIEHYNIRVLNIFPETIADGEGLRYSIYLSGCTHGCHGCHNLESWNPQAGELLTTPMLTQMILEINENMLLDGVTLSGGDPFYNIRGLLVLLKILKKNIKGTIWCYTGYTYEQLCANEQYQRALIYVDVLIDGRFDISKFDPSLSFIGSSNQRVLYLQEHDFSLKY
ncbi:anaerobic ribonucleotide reductase activating protein [Erysipelotrichaceae bacterium]|nr:anaerobic ribonucleotide reductase activating protein [Erysipelotrichaceae bacterium]